MVHVPRLLATIVLVFVAGEAAWAVTSLRELFALHGPLSEFDLPELTEAGSCYSSALSPIA